MVSQQKGTRLHNFLAPTHAFIACTAGGQPPGLPCTTNSCACSNLAVARACTHAHTRAHTNAPTVAMPGSLLRAMCTPVKHVLFHEVSQLRATAVITGRTGQRRGRSRGPGWPRGACSSEAKVSAPLERWQRRGMAGGAASSGAPAGGPAQRSATPPAGAAAHTVQAVLAITRCSPSASRRGPQSRRCRTTRTAQPRSPRRWPPARRGRRAGGAGQTLSMGCRHGTHKGGPA